MYPSSLPRRSIANLTTLFLLSTIMLQAAAQETSPNDLFRRAESIGSACSSEGQWNCMTNSFQRCASGQWSAEMNCTEGTVCSPSGHTDVFRIDYKDARQKGQAPSTSGARMGLEACLSLRVVQAVFGMWAILVFCL